MGTWGPNSFQNDWALDWLGDLRESGDASPIRSALSAVVEHGGTKPYRASLIERMIGMGNRKDWLTADVASKALAASEVVAVWHGQPASNLPETVTPWV